jgi:hypothetical protein
MDNNYQGLFNSGKEHIFYLMRDRSFCQVLRRSSHCSPLVVPTSMGRLVLCMGAISTTVEITSDTTSSKSSTCWLEELSCSVDKSSQIQHFLFVAIQSCCKPCAAVVIGRGESVITSTHCACTRF